MNDQMNEAMQIDESSPDARYYAHPKISLGIAYVPFQRWEQPYESELAFHRGTMFPSLDMPFIGEEALPNDR